MSDFTSDFWSIYVGAITVVSILACGVLLWVAGTTKVKPGQDNTTGHVWDGDLRELNNPLPRWWVWLFVITIVFALAYGLLYPMYGRYAGVLGWTSSGQHTVEVQRHQEAIQLGQRQDGFIVAVLEQPLIELLQPSVVHRHASA